MKKAEFLSLLQQKISILPKQELEDALGYYSEMIDDYIESGYTPEQAVAQMGGVDNVAAQVLAGNQSPVYEAYGVRKCKRKSLLWLTILGFPVWFPLLVAAFCIVFAVAVVLAVVGIVVPWALVIAFGASAVALFATTPIIFTNEGIAGAALAFGAALVLLALCIFSLWAALRLTKICSGGIGAMFKGFFRLFFGRR